MSRPDMRRVGVIGLGVMGRAMVRNLLRAGFEVVVHNRSTKSQRQLVDEGAAGAASPAEVAKSAEILLTVLSDDLAVRAVTFGPAGILAGIQPGAVWADLSTVSVDLTREIADATAEAGAAAIDAPVSGGESGAVEGTLAIMAGGAPDAYERCRPVLEVLGSNVAFLGPAGSGQIAKAANQMIVAGVIGALAEAIVFLEAQKVDVQASLNVIGKGYAANRILEIRGDRMVSRDFTPGGRVALQDKDLRLALRLARDSGVATPVTNVAAELFRSLCENGWGDRDHTAVIHAIDLLSDRQTHTSCPAMVGRSMNR